MGGILKLSAGSEYLIKLVQEGLRDPLLNTPRMWYVETEVGLLNFLQNHIRTYNQMPTIELLAHNGYNFDLSPLIQPVEYYREAVRQRYLVGIASNSIPILNSVIQTRDVDLLRQSAAQIIEAFSLDDVHNLNITTFDDAARRGIAAADEALYSTMLGIPTGWDISDQLLGGYQSADLHVIVGRPGTGKTYVLLKSILEAWRQGVSPLVVTPEMSDVQLATRMLAIITGINPQMFRTGEISTWARNNMFEIMAGIPEQYPPLHFMVVETRATLDDVERAVERTNPQGLYIDAGYLLSTGKGGKYQTRRESIADVMESTKGLAVRTDLPIIDTVQFNRNIKTNKKSGKIDANMDMSIEDVAETDVIGQIAYSVMGIHPPSRSEASQRFRILQYLKHRNGDLLKFKINYLFNPPNFDFIEVVREQDENSESDVAESEVTRQIANMGWND